MAIYIDSRGTKHTISNTTSAVACAMNDVGLAPNSVYYETYRRALDNGASVSVQGPNGSGTLIPEASDMKSGGISSPSAPKATNNFEVSEGNYALINYILMLGAFGGLVTYGALASAAFFGLMGLVYLHKKKSMKDNPEKWTKDKFEEDEE